MSTAAAVHKGRASKWGSSEVGRTLYVDGIEVIDLELERSLVFWRTRHGLPHHALRTFEHWLEAWEKWGEFLTQKCIEAMPGHRPAVAYAAGIIPARPVLAAMPRWWAGKGIVVMKADGTSTAHYDLPEPYQRHEALHLHDLGIVDRDELQRLRERERHGNRAGYTFEIAKYR